MKKRELKLSQQEKMDLYFEKEYRRMNANHKNDPKTFSVHNKNLQPTGKPDGNIKRDLNYHFATQEFNMYSNYRGND